MVELTPEHHPTYAASTHQFRQAHAGRVPELWHPSERSPLMQKPTRAHSAEWVLLTPIL